MILVHRIATILGFASIFIVGAIQLTYTEPEDVDFHSQSSEFNSWKEKNKGTIGEKYGEFLTFVNGNTKQWSESYDVWLEDHTHEELKYGFSSYFERPLITTFFSGFVQDLFALNRVCERIYYFPISEITWPPNEISSKQERLREDLWRYCTPFEGSPITVEQSFDEDQLEGKIIEKTEYQKVLLSTNEDDNKKLWKRKQELFFNGEPPKDGLFSKLYLTKKEIFFLDSPKSLQDACNTAYQIDEEVQKPGEEDSQVGDDEEGDEDESERKEVKKKKLIVGVGIEDVLKYCSL